MANRILKTQTDDEQWRESLLNQEGFEYGEKSGSGFIIYALVWRINHDLLTE